MSVLNKYNKKVSFQFDGDKERDFTNLKDLHASVGKDVTVLEAIFINTKSRFGDAPTLVTSDKFVNAPQHLLKDAKEMLEDSEFINMVNERRVGFKIYSYEGKNGQGYSVEWVEIG